MNGFKESRPKSFAQHKAWITQHLSTVSSLLTRVLSPDLSTWGVLPYLDWTEVWCLFFVEEDAFKLALWCIPTFAPLIHTIRIPLPYGNTPIHVSVTSQELRVITYAETRKWKMHMNLHEDSDWQIIDLLDTAHESDRAQRLYEIYSPNRKVASPAMLHQLHFHSQKLELKCSGEPGHEACSTYAEHLQDYIALTQGKFCYTTIA